MPVQRDPLPVRVCLFLIRIISVLVPGRHRSDWRREWEAEVRHSQVVTARRSRTTWRTDANLMRRALGALPDAAWLRRQFTADSESVQDLRHGGRMLRQNPSFTVAAVMILAVGIGGTVSIATLLDTLLFRPLPYADEGRIVTVWQRSPAGKRDDVAPANFVDWRERSRSFEAIAAAIPYSYDYTGGGEPETFFGAQVTERFWETLGIVPALGRTFLPEEHVTGAPPVAIITDGLWKRRFGSDPAIINRAISLDGTTWTVVGVLPREFNPQLLPRPGELSVWTPKVIQDHEKRTRGSAWWNVIARLKPGVGLADAQAEMTTIAAALGAKYPRTNEGVGVELVSLRDHLMGGVRLPLFVLLGAVLLVLTIGCANVASLLLARGLNREREFAIRAALGAGRARLVRQLVAESLLLSGLSAAAGIAFAYWAIGLIVALAPSGIVRLQDAYIDGRILAFAAGLTTVTALAFGILPALQFSRPARDAMRERGASAPRGRARRALVAAEVALALVLLTGAGLLLRSFERLLAVDPGFSPGNAVALQVFVWDRHAAPDRTRAFFRDTLNRLQALPGVEAAGAVSAMPFANANIDIKSSLAIHGREEKPAGEEHQVYLTIATPGYFRAMRIPLREGRFIEETDRQQGLPVALVSDALRRREWPDESPLGRTITLQWQGKPIEAQIVGVVSPIRHDGLDSTPRAEVFVPLEQVPFASMTYVLRGEGDTKTLLDAAKAAVWTVDPLLPFYEVGSVRQMVSASLARQRFSVSLLSAFAAIALALCAVGIYSVMSFATAQRTREIGVRMALGADRCSIRRMILGEGALVVGVGMTCGLIAAAAATQYIRTLLFEVRAMDPLTLCGVCVLLLAVALLACYVPAARATRVDPVVALRIE
jgi:putative ABC transport system permease protein